MGNIRQKCPKCGNWVEGKPVKGFARKITRGAVKKGAAMATGAAIGSVVPGLGTIVGGALGMIAGTLLEDDVNKVADASEKFLWGDVDNLQFHCPKCGHEWGSNKQLDSVTAVHDENVYSELVDNREEEKILEKLTYLLDNTESIIATRNTTLRYLDSLERLYYGFDERIKSAIHFLWALCAYYYSEEHIEDKSLIKKGLFHINESIKLYDKNDEYTVLQLMFMSMNINHDSPNVVDQQVQISKRCPNIFSIKNNFLDKGYLESIYCDARYSSLIDTCVSLEKRNKFKDYEKCLLLLAKNNNIESKIVANYELSLLYYHGKGDVVPSETKCFLYTKNAVDVIDLEESFAANADSILYRMWLECLAGLGILYIQGHGTSVDYEKGLSLSLRAANLGASYSMYVIGEIYEYGKGCKPDLQQAKLWYQKAADAGYDGAMEKLKELSNSTKRKSLNDSKTEIHFADNNDKHYSFTSSAESEYLEEVKACLEGGEEISSRERRLLNRLRDRLGISETRANELEESLKKPQLTPDEQEYLEEYRACLEEGKISSKERRLLDRLRDKLGIHPSRAKELENL